MKSFKDGKESAPLSEGHVANEPKALSSGCQVYVDYLGGVDDTYCAPPPEKKMKAWQFHGHPHYDKQVSQVSSGDDGREVNIKKTNIGVCICELEEKRRDPFTCTL